MYIRGRAYKWLQNIHRVGSNCTPLNEWIFGFVGSSSSLARYHFPNKFIVKRLQTKYARDQSNAGISFLSQGNNDYNMPSIIFLCICFIKKSNLSPSFTRRTIGVGFYFAGTAAGAGGRGFLPVPHTVECQESRFAGLHH
jgi:hypothetical protein